MRFLVLAKDVRGEISIFQIKFEDAERICSMILFEGILGRACYPGRDEERPVRTFTIIAITEGKEDVNKIYIKKINLRLKKYYYNVSLTFNVDVIFKKWHLH